MSGRMTNSLRLIKLSDIGNCALLRTVPGNTFNINGCKARSLAFIGNPATYTRISFSSFKGKQVPIITTCSAVFDYAAAKSHQAGLYAFSGLACNHDIPYPAGSTLTNYKIRGNNAIESTSVLGRELLTRNTTYNHPKGFSDHFAWAMRTPKIQATYFYIGIVTYNTGTLKVKVTYRDRLNVLHTDKYITPKLAINSVPISVIPSTHSSILATVFI